jgi:hypothetical protein
VNAVLRPLEDALARWNAEGHRVDFWLRDDDAVEPTPALDRLIAMTGSYGVPLTLAVIPAHAKDSLARQVDGSRHVTPVVHGWSHQNHAPADQKKQELGPHRPIADVLDELAEARRRMAGLFGSRMQAVLVPPWNRVDPNLFPHLEGLGFRALSVFGAPKPAPIRMINSTVDIMDWQGTRGCRDHGVLVREIVTELDAAFVQPNHVPIGILTHHLVHDESAWAFLESLFEVTTRDDTSGWRSIAELLDR